MENLIGAVLCGGQSRRMGRDKGLIEQEGKPWAVLVAEKLTGLGLPVVVSVNNKQREDYSQIFANTPLVIDGLQIDGPLEGLLTVHKNYSEKDLLLLACDLIDMDAETIQTLLQAYLKEPGFDFYVYEQDGFSQPFCAIYTSAALKNIYHQYEEKQLKKFSLHDRFGEGKSKFLPLKNLAAFNNYNSLG